MIEVPNEIKALVGSIKATRNTWANGQQANNVNYELTTTCGFKWLGQGSYSRVYYHPGYPDVVFKISYNAHDGYHKYVEWIIDNRDRLKPSIRKHLPKIYDTYVAKGGVRVTVLEVLQYRAYGKKAHEEALEESSYVNTDELLTNLTACFRGINDDSGGDNVMIRRGRTAVITDPWSRKRYS